MYQQYDPKKMMELEKLRMSEKIEEENFVNKMLRICNMFTSRGFSEEAAAQFAIAFYKDPVLQKKRAKRKSKSEIMDS